MKRSSLFLCGCASIALAVLLATPARAGIVDGLQAYYPLNGDFLDASGNNLHGMERGTPIVFGPGQFGQGIVLDGGNQYVEINGGIDGNIVSDLDFAGGSMSVSAWFRVDAFDTTWQALVAKGEQDGWRLHRRGDDQTMAYTGGQPDTPGGILNVNDGQIHHIVATSDNGFKTVYIDGVLDAQGQQDPIGIPNNNQNVRIGDNPSSPGREWEGLIDDVAIWDRALTVDEVAFLWNNGAGNIPIIPEPTSIVLAVIGLLGLGAFGRRRRRRS